MLERDKTSCFFFTGNLRAKGQNRSQATVRKITPPSGIESYNDVCRQNQLISVGCWEHTPRKFREAKDGQPRAMSGKLSKADIALGIINKL
jgi:hypothetical protein